MQICMTIGINPMYAQDVKNKSFGIAPLNYTYFNVHGRSKVFRSIILNQHCPDITESRVTFLKQKMALLLFYVFFFNRLFL